MEVSHRGRDAELRLGLSPLRAFHRVCILYTQPFYGRYSCQPAAAVVESGTRVRCHRTPMICVDLRQVVFMIHTFSQTISRVDASQVRWIFCFGMANSMVNPLIYGAFHLKMRRFGAGKRSAMY